MEYTTYWSILDSPSHSIKSNIIGLIIALVAALCWLLVKIFKKENKDLDKAKILWASGVFTVLGVAMFLFLTYIYPDNTNNEVANLLVSQKLPKIEGVVSDFQRTYRRGGGGYKRSYRKETIESFKIDTVQFAYGDALFGKFNSFTKINNDVIYNGQFVRITYSSDSPYGNNCNSILKLEIARR